MSTDPTGRTERSVDVLVVGAGPAGLSIAAALASAGVPAVEVVEREPEPGGIPRHSRHTGYGLRDLHRALTGPQYAGRLLAAAGDAGVRVRVASTVTGWGTDGNRALELTAPTGLERITAGAVVLATGARERARAARLVPGDRPAGVFTTGELQQAVEAGLPIGRRAVVVGAEHVSYSAVLTLRHAGVQVAAMVTELPRPQSYPVFAAGSLLRLGVRAVTGTTLTRVLGADRVEAVELRHAAGRTALLGCDTVVFTGGWIPDHELARRGGLELDDGTLGPVVGAGWRTSLPGVFAVGNLVHPVATADVCVLGARSAAAAVLDRWRRQVGAGGGAGEAWAAPAGAEVRVRAERPLRWVVPQRVSPSGPPPDRFLIWADAEVARPVLRVVQAGRVLHEQRLGRRLVPNRAVELPATWVSRTDPAPHSGPVTLTLAALPSASS